MFSWGPEWRTPKGCCSASLCFYCHRSLVSVCLSLIWAPFPLGFGDRHGLSPPTTDFLSSSSEGTAFLLWNRSLFINSVLAAYLLWFGRKKRWDNAGDSRQDLECLVLVGQCQLILLQKLKARNFSVLLQKGEGVQKENWTWVSTESTEAGGWDFLSLLGTQWG